MSETTVNLGMRDSHLAKKEAKKRLKSFEKDPNWDLEKKTFGVEAYYRAYRGLMGELAFAKYAGLTIDPNQYEKTDQGEDFYVEYCGARVSIDIKAANKEPYALMVKEGPVSADYYIQCHVDNLTVTFYGMATGEEVESRELVDTPREHRNREIPIEELEPIPEPEALKPIG
jgi:hypothetical protein